MLRRWIEKYQQRRWVRAWINSPQIKNTRVFLSNLYHNIDAHLISSNTRKALDITDPAYTYGEINFFSFAAALKVCNPQAGEIFYDIGSGAGKTVFASALLYDFSKTCGIEALDILHQLSLKQLELFKIHIKKYKFFSTRKFNINFIAQDLVSTYFLDADIIFVNATCYIGELWDNLQEKIHQLKIGSRIILASKRLPNEQYILIDSQIAITSWGTSSVFIYKKIA